MRLATVVLAAAALVPAAPARAPVTCRYRMDYRGEITRIQVMHHNLTHETIPFRSHGILTVRLTDSTPARHLELSLDSLAVTRADGSPLPDAEGGAGSRWSGDIGPKGDVVALTSPGLVPGTRALDRFTRFLFAPWGSADSKRRRAGGHDGVGHQPERRDRLRTRDLDLRVADGRTVGGKRAPGARGRVERQPKRDDPGGSAADDHHRVGNRQSRVHLPRG